MFWTVHVQGQNQMLRHQNTFGRSQTLKLYLATVFLYLKLWPVHMHAWAIGATEPLQIFLRIG